MTTLGATSNLSVTSGVPQGSIFVFVPSVCQVSARCSYIKPDCGFCRWYKGFKEITSKHDAEQLQGDLSDLITWSDSAGLNFKYRKCKAQRITRKLKPVNFDYCIADSQLEVVSVERDLGVKPHVITSRGTCKSVSNALRPAGSRHVYGESPLSSKELRLDARHTSP